MSILVSICARKGSRGVINKNIKKVGNQSLISLAIKDARKLKFKKDIVFSTDSQEYLDSINQKKIIKIKRPKKLALNITPKWEVFRHLVNQYNRMKGFLPDVLVDLDVGTPFRKNSDIEMCLKLLMKEKKIDCVTTGYESERNPYFNMVSLKKNGFGKIVCKSPNIIYARQKAPRVFSLSPVCFAIKTESILKYTNWSESNFKIHEISRESGIDIDTEFDLKVAKLLWPTVKKDNK